MTMTITYTIIHTDNGVTFTTQYTLIEGTGNYDVQRRNDDDKTETHLGTRTLLEVADILAYFRTRDDAWVTGELIEEELDAVGNVTSTTKRTGG